ncbi:G-protein alpha subunit [Russula compacta]|nr:G-protein alpha subunit [Russula compacta]
MLPMNPFASWKQRRMEKKAKILAKAHSDTIDRQLEEESKNFRRQHNVLLISTPKSEAEAFAMVKHMKVIHENYSSEELADFRPAIWKILLENSRSIVQALRKSRFKHAYRATKANCEFILGHRSDTDNPEFLFQPEFAQVVQDLWAGEIIPLLLDRPSYVRLADNAEYFFAEAQRIAAEEYVPSIEDICHASERGVTDTHFNIDQLSMRVSQVYGQRGDRKKWIHLFEGVTSIIFCVPLSDYDEPGVPGKRARTRLTESLVLFESVVNSRWFPRTSIVLFLTELDDFRAKLHEVPLAKYFPGYTGGTDVNKGVEYIRRRFMQANRAQLNIYTHFTEASGTANMRLVFFVLRETVFRNTLSVVDLV